MDHPDAGDHPDAAPEGSTLTGIAPPAQQGLGTNLGCGYPGCDHVFTRLPSPLVHGDYHLLTSGDGAIAHLLWEGRWVLLVAEPDEAKLRRYRETLREIKVLPHLWEERFSDTTRQSARHGCLSCARELRKALEGAGDLDA